jgi:hypothetical protein
VLNISAPLYSLYNYYSKSVIFGQPFYGHKKAPKIGGFSMLFLRNRSYYFLASSFLAGAAGAAGLAASALAGALASAFGASFFASALGASAAKVLTANKAATSANTNFIFISF